MKRYLVFAYDGYYPSGGWQDFVMATDDLEDAKKAVARKITTRSGDDFSNIVDSITLKVIYEREG